MKATHKASRLFFSAVFAFVLQASALAAPAQIVIIRHGEKPSTGNELNTQGCERAYLLPGFFLHNAIVNQFGKPAGIFAMRPDSGDGSVRAEQTIAPTAAQLGLTIDDTYTKTQYSAIDQSIMNQPTFDQKTVLIAWEHKAIPGLAAQFGVKLNDQTDSWPGAVFDEAWIIRLTAGEPPSLQIIPESTMPTDNPLGGFSDWQNGPTANPSGPSVPTSIESTCQSNAAINALVGQWASPPLPTL